MSNIMGGQPYKRPGRTLQGILYCSLSFIAMFPYITPSMLMGELMADFGCDVAMAGLCMNIQLAVAGIFMFVGGFVTDRIGVLKTAKMGAWFLTIGCAISAFAPNIGVFLFARALAGIGQGCAVALTEFLTYWFIDKERAFWLTANGFGSAIAITVSVSVAVPLMNAFGGNWKGPFYVYIALSLAFALLWTFGGKMSPEGIEQEKANALARQAAKEAGQSSSTLTMAIKIKPIWIICIFVWALMIVDSTRATFLPTYMMTDLGVPPTLATTAISLVSFVGMLGTILGGVLVTKISNRKVIMIGSVACYVIGGLLLTILPPGIGSVICCCALGFFYFLPQTAQNTFIIETSLEHNPAAITGAFSLSLGIGMMGNLVVSSIYAALAGGMGATGAFRTYFIVLMVAALSLLLIRKKSTSIPA